MEIKKSSNADLDNRRLQGFLLGLILVLAVLFVGLEFRYMPPSDDYDYEALDQVIHELDLSALKEEEERIPLIAKPVVEIPKSPDKLNVVNDETETEPQDDEEIAPPDPDAEYRLAEDGEEKTEPAAVDADNNPLHIKVVEQMPEFPGGATAFMKWLTKNLRYPRTAQQRKVQGKVVAQFIVNADGTVSDLKIVQPLDPVCDREAMRVLKLMPKWKAGMQDEKPCRTMVAIPIVFKM